MSDSFLLFDRRYRVQVKDLDVSELRCVFKVKRSLRSEPNTCDLQIYNLSEDQRRSLENLPDRREGTTLKQMAALPTSNPMAMVEAGYKSTGTSLIYLGEVRTAHSVSEGSDVVTHLSSGDGEKDMQTSRIHVPIGPKTSIDVALTALVRELGCGEGNLQQMIPKLRLSGAAEMYVAGSVLSGSAADELDAFCKAANIEWSIQNGRLQLLDRSKGLEGDVLVLSADTGLIGSPSVDNKGIVSFTTLIIPNLVPGKRVVFEAKSLKGVYRVDDCTYSGDTYGKEWYIECKGQLPGTAVTKTRGKKFNPKD